MFSNQMTAYIGAGGDLKTNTYKEFVANNPYVSPTLFITQTNKKYSFFGGFNGKLSPMVSYDIKASYSDEDDKPMFVKNNSKSDGSTPGSLLGYEYGNSFAVIYDDIQTLSFNAEMRIDISPNLMIGANSEFNSYTLTTQSEVLNLPTMRAEIFGNYTFDQWYGSVNAFVVSSRNDLSYNAIYPAAINGVKTLKSYVDLNINGGYHINKQFTAFLRLSNILNSDYQQFSNFTVQGFQVLGGVSYKFDF